MPRTATALTICASLFASPLHAYPIDCAILLCMAGGFPASAECTAAKATMIRRITPFPVEPPLQLWNCPMGISADLAAQIGISQSSDGLTPEVREYRDAIEIYDIRKFEHSQIHQDVTRIDVTYRGEYAQTDGTFRWVPASYVTAPGWVAEAVGGTMVPVEQCQTWAPGDAGTCTASSTTFENDYDGYLRAIVMRTKAYDGSYIQQVVKY